MFIRNLYKKYFVEDKLFRNTLVVLLIALGVVFVYSDAKSDEADKLPVVTQKLVNPPFYLNMTMLL